MVWRFCSERELFNLLPCVAEQYRGDTEETIVSEERGWKDFIRFLAVKVNPSVLRPPFILLCKTQRRRFNSIAKTTPLLSFLYASKRCKY